MRLFDGLWLWTCSVETWRSKTTCASDFSLKTTCSIYSLSLHFKVCTGRSQAQSTKQGLWVGTNQHPLLIHHAAQQHDCCGCTHEATGLD